MKNYRIKKFVDGDFVRYYPQVKVLGLFWWNMFDRSDYYDGFRSYDKAKKELCDALKKPKAKKELCDALKKPKVEYFDVNCE